MTKYIFSLIVCALISNYSLAQKNTYFNHKNLFEVSYATYFPFFADGTRYVNENGVMDLKEWGTVQHGLHVGYTRTLATRFGFGVEFDYGTAMYTPPGLQANLNNGDYLLFFTEKMKAQYTSIIGKVEFGRREGIFPIGVTHQLGAGYSMYSLAEPEGELTYRIGKDYAYYLENKPEIPFEYKTSWKNVSGMTAFYNLNFRLALTKNVLLNFGVRYNANIVFRNRYTASQDTGELIEQSDFADQMYLRMGRQFVRLYAGVAISF